MGLSTSVSLPYARGAMSAPQLRSLVRASLLLACGGCVGASASIDPPVTTAPPAEIELAPLAPPAPPRIEPPPRPVEAAPSERAEPYLDDPPPSEAFLLDGPSIRSGAVGGVPGGVPGGVAGTGAVSPPSPSLPPPPKPTLVQSSLRCTFPKDVDPDVDSGRVVLRVQVDASGAVTKVLVLADPGHGFGRAARDCVANARFVAARDEQAQPVASETTLTVRFQR